MGRLCSCVVSRPVEVAAAPPWLLLPPRAAVGACDSQPSCLRSARPAARRPKRLSATRHPRCSRRFRFRELASAKASQRSRQTPPASGQRGRRRPAFPSPSARWRRRSRSALTPARTSLCLRGRSWRVVWGLRGRCCVSCFRLSCVSLGSPDRACDCIGGVGRRAVAAPSRRYCIRPPSGPAPPLAAPQLHKAVACRRGGDTFGLHAAGRPPQSIRKGAKKVEGKASI